MDSLLSLEALDEQSLSLTINVLLKGISECRLKVPPLTPTTRDQTETGYIWIPLITLIASITNSIKFHLFSSTP